ncbi:hypothetical protein KIN20_024638 [Parelaphostrongylus tenuis]|uniref:7TM GPCR serpentine receptor class x (Srx) domain-containing protein n=1 Tax=Parelaphostrongylus tenuis TaxID=148309 RepID=A0AAD5MTT6_PARTN|nr:hypothetical protein KIN20_024638 [Parelaphostrongylus tenuis]
MEFERAIPRHFETISVGRPYGKPNYLRKRHLKLVGLRPCPNMNRKGEHLAITRNPAPHVGVLGLVSNSVAILAVRYNPVLTSSFGLLYLSHTIANIGGLIVLVFCVTPITLIGQSKSMIFGVTDKLGNNWQYRSEERLAVSTDRVKPIWPSEFVSHNCTKSLSLCNESE